MELVFVRMLDILESFTESALCAGFHKPHVAAPVAF
jgi:hypothetical protein